MDREKLVQACRLFLEAIGEDAEREGLIETPLRFAKRIEEQLKYTGISNEEIAKEFNKCFIHDGNNMVVETNIPVFSFCEHHIALMYNMTVSVGYIPRGKVIGLSKIARIADAVCKRLQIQERIGTDIAEILKSILETDDVIVLIDAEHSCMTARGIAKTGVKTRTITCSGCFYEHSVKAEFLSAVR